MLSHSMPTICNYYARPSSYLMINKEEAFVSDQDVETGTKFTHLLEITTKTKTKYIKWGIETEEKNARAMRKCM